MSGNKGVGNLPQFERNKYFYGKLMTVGDFETEQSYFIEKQRLINRLIHGSGVVCGLKVEKVDSTKIKINPGVALDCCGREIVVPEEKEHDIKEDLTSLGVKKVYVLLKYDKCEKDPKPVVSNVSSCEGICCYGRIKESYKIEITKDMPQECLPPDERICGDWHNLVKVSAKIGSVLYFERVVPKFVQKGEVFEVTVNVKASENISYFEIVDSLPSCQTLSCQTLYSGSLSLVGKIKNGKTIIHTYWVKPEVVGSFDITGEIGLKKSQGDSLVTNPLPESSIEITETPEEEKAKRFIEYWIKGCPECPQDPAVVLAAISLQKRGGSFEITEVDNAIVYEEGFKKSLVFSNPQLYELIKCIQVGQGLEEGLTVIENIDPPFGEKIDLDSFWFSIVDDKDNFKSNLNNGNISKDLEGAFKTKDFPLSETAKVTKEIHPWEITDGEKIYYLRKSFGNRLYINLEKGIQVTFSNPVEDVNEDTFQVAVFAPSPRLTRDGIFLTRHYEYIEGSISASDDKRTFTFKPKINTGQSIKAVLDVISPFINLEHERGRKLNILVQIKCDFIKDKKGKAVAGHHLFPGKSGLNIGGRYNIQGGIFESGFTLYFGDP